MSAFSNYLEKAILDLTLRGVALTPPTSVWIALFTANPTDASLTVELSDSGYARQDAAKGGSLETGWELVVDDAGGNGKVTSNKFSLPFPAIVDGPVTVTHFGIFDAQTGGNLLYHGPLNRTKDLGVDDVVTVDPGLIKVIVD
nr:hypothetical protein [uncultured Halomonas sp.]